MLKKFTIYGERCSGTNYLEGIIQMNFDVDITWEYGWKHFFGFQDDQLKNSDDTLFICIVRNLPDWINSFYRTPHHINDINCRSVENFLSKEIISYELNSKSFNGKSDFQGKESLEDRNIYTGERYKNIFELRHTKIKWMLEDLPNKVKNCLFIRYEDLINDFDKTLLKIKDKGIKVKENINFPLNTSIYKNQKKTIFIKKENSIPNDLILCNSNLIPLYEKKLYQFYENPKSNLFCLRRIKFF